MRLGMGLRLSDLLKHGATPSTLLDGLVSYWSLNEESGTRYDAVGSNDLTDNNTVGFDTGVNGNAASFVAANSESLSTAATLSYDQAPFTLNAWLNVPVGTVDGTYRSPINNGYRHTLKVYVSGGVVSSVRHEYYDGVGYRLAYNAVSIPLGSWFMATVAMDDAFRQYVWTNGEFEATNNTGVALPVNTAHPFQIGSHPAEGAWTVLSDEVAIWDRVLTADERAKLYNAGSGFFYPFT